ncbi:MAG: 50S ribosomal protein L4 [Nitrospirae bacterium]|nr:50S ribosomal protein L4 [Nitrospirota bacterium]
MPTVPVVNRSNEKVGECDLPAPLFGRPYRKDLIHAAVVAHLARLRQGTASTLNRAAIEGGKKKPWKQKHTGRARAGSTVSPLWPGGAIVFGPTPRDYGWRLPKKMNRAALGSALSHQLKSGNLLVVDQAGSEKGKTKDVVKWLSGLGVGENVLLVDATPDPLLRRAVRNLPKVRLVAPQNLDVYTVMLHRKIVVTAQAVEALRKRCDEAATAAAQ